MDWISEHLLQIIIAIAAAVAAYINNRNKEKNGEPADFDGDGTPDNRPGQFEPSKMDMEEADRTRRIQEEIRRKIAERQAGQSPVPPLVAPRPVAEPVPEVVQRRFEKTEEPAPPPLPRKLSAGAQADRDAEVLERQRALEEQMRLLEARRRSTNARHKRRRPCCLQRWPIVRRPPPRPADLNCSRICAVRVARAAPGFCAKCSAHRLA